MWRIPWGDLPALSRAERHPTIEQDATIKLFRHFDSLLPFVSNEYV
jgi:hypothetical protein